MKEKITGQIESLRNYGSMISTYINNRNVLDCLDPFNVEIMDRRFKWNIEEDHVLTNTIHRASIYSSTGDDAWINLDINFHTGYFNNEFPVNTIMDTKYKVRIVLNNGWKIRFNNMKIDAITYENNEHRIVKPVLRCDGDDITFINSDYAEFKFNSELMKLVFNSLHRHIRETINQQIRNDMVPDLNFGTISLEEMEGKE